MGSRYKLTTIITIVFLVASTAYGVEISNGSLRLVVHENTGRFSLYRTGTQETALFVAEDPTTTYITLLENQRIYRLGDSFAYRQRVTSTDSAVSILWTSSRLEIRQTLTLEGDALEIDIRINNVSETAVPAGIRYLIDTYLGEDDTHFRTDSASISSERSFSDDLPDYILTESSDNRRLYIPFGVSGVDNPDRIVLANWKRLNDTTWSYTVNTNRNFNLPPYSINDSAIALYYEPQELGSGEARRVSFILAARLEGEDTTATTSGTGTTDTTSGTSQLPPGARTGTGQPSSREVPENIETIRSDMETINGLIESIDTLLEADRPPSEDELEDMKEALRLLEEHKERYEQ